MLTILPMEDRQRERELLEAIPEKAGDDARILMMRDGTSELGWVAVELLHSVLRMIHMEIPGCEKLDGLSGENRLYRRYPHAFRRLLRRCGGGLPDLFFAAGAQRGSWLQGGSLPGENGAQADLGVIVKYTGPQ